MINYDPCLTPSTPIPTHHHLINKSSLPTLPSHPPSLHSSSPELLQPPHHHHLILHPMINLITISPHTTDSKPQQPSFRPNMSFVQRQTDLPNRLSDQPTHSLLCNPSRQNFPKRPKRVSIQCSWKFWPTHLALHLRDEVEAAQVEWMHHLDGPDRGPYPLLSRG